MVKAFTAFIQLLYVFYYYELLQSRNRFAYVLYPGKENNLLIAEIGGVVFFLLILEPVFKKLYRKWYALPDN